MKEHIQSNHPRRKVKIMAISVHGDMIVNPIILYGRMPNWLWNLGVAKNNSAF